MPNGTRDPEDDGGACKLELGAGRLNILTIHCNGLRKKEKRLALGHLITWLRVGVAVLTETHGSETHGHPGICRGHSFLSAVARSQHWRGSDYSRERGTDCGRGPGGGRR